MRSLVVILDIKIAFSSSNFLIASANYLSIPYSMLNRIIHNKAPHLLETTENRFKDVEAYNPVPSSMGCINLKYECIIPA